MVAQRKAQATPRRRAVVAGVQPRQTASDDDVDPARELARLQAMRADARQWLAELERRIEALECVGVCSIRAW